MLKLKFKKYFSLKSYLWEICYSIMSLDTVKRFDRIVAILIQLQSKRIVKAQELADRFEVSLRTIYRDIRTLEASGVPIISEAGVGYSIMEGYRLPPVMFTREEVGSFVAAEKLMQKFEAFLASLVDVPSLPWQNHQFYQCQSQLRQLLVQLQ